MKLVSVAVVTGMAAVAVIVYRSRHGVEVWHTTEDRPA
ncbi:hypothetical protein CRI78_14200 [Mycolicibacterium diernhoferi]|uniref:Uncharacterized protein n=1 Tax=Mycolicibacterium diernhoferi TaxID=1801 RepID=A0A2A7NUW9_9MYCO|nr:hypothetical protein CRI78_14200 [Mycolicibacterium diernhoferi]